MLKSEETRGDSRGATRSSREGPGNKAGFNQSG